MEQVLPCDARTVNAAAMPLVEMQRPVRDGQPSSGARPSFEGSPLGRFLAQRRIAAQLSRNALAVRIGLHSSTISRYEANHILPEAPALVSLSRALGFDAPPVMALVNRIRMAKAEGQPLDFIMPPVALREPWRERPRVVGHDGVVGQATPGGRRMLPLLDQDEVGHTDPETLQDMIAGWRGDLLDFDASHPGCFAVENPSNGLSRRIPLGARVIVDPNDRTFASGMVFLIRHHGRIMARVAAGRGARARFEPDSDEPGYSVVYCSDGDDLAIVGRIRAHQTAHDMPIPGKDE